MEKPTDLDESALLFSVFFNLVDVAPNQAALDVRPGTHTYCRFREEGRSGEGGVGREGSAVYLSLQVRQPETHRVVSSARDVSQITGKSGTLSTHTCEYTLQLTRHHKSSAHRRFPADEEELITSLPSLRMALPACSATVMNSRAFHRGSANNSTKMRPVAYYSILETRKGKKLPGGSTVSFKARGMRRQEARG